MLDRAAQVLLWAPAAAAIVYIAVLARSIGSVFDQLGWDADSVSPMLLAEALGRGPAGGQILVGHMGYYPMLAFDLVTGSLPFHREAWTVFPYVLSILGISMLAWVAWSLAGRWAAAVALVLGIAVSPTVLLSLASQGYRAATLFNTVVLFSFTVLLMRGRPAAPAYVAAGFLVAVITGVNLASDTFLALWGLGPFLIAPMVTLALWPERRQVAVFVHAAAVAAGAIMCAAVTTRLAYAAGFRQLSVNAAVNNVPETMQQVPVLASSLAKLFAGPTTGRHLAGNAMAVVAAGLGLVGLLLVLLLTASLLRARRTGPTVDRLRAACTAFWGSSVLLVALAVLATNFASDTSASRYLLTFHYGVAAVVPLWACAGGARRVAVGLGAAAFCLLSAAALDSAVHLHRFQPGHTVELPRAVAAIESKGLTRGYSTYWDANVISWKTEGRVRVYPIVITGSGTREFVSNLVTSWYQPAPGTPTFVLVDPAVPFVQVVPEPAIGQPSEILQVDRFTIAFYPNEIVGHVGAPLPP